MKEDARARCARSADSDGKRVLCFILIGYVLIGSLYAFLTPPWQVPDEPAHYNYVRQLAEEGRFPRLIQGDYDQALLERIVAERFPEAAPLQDLRYENHQPPLYYLLAVPVYRSTGGSLIALRLFSLALAAGIVLLAHAVARRIYPQQPLIALGTAAFVAFLPQHTATMAGVNNDGLAGLLIAAIVLLSIRIVQKPVGAHRELLLLGVVLGLGLIAKATVYPMVAVVLAAAGGRWWLHRDGGFPLRNLVLQVLVIMVPALLIAAPWWIRNAMLYGWPDLLGLIRHAAVVEGQPRTAQWIAAHGWAAWFERGLRFTFQSFWGQFGWMSVVMDFRVYFALTLATALAVLGCVLPGARLSRGERAPGFHLLVVQSLVALSAFMGYNAVLVQNQGRYLFPALIPIAMVFAVGLLRLTSASRSRDVALGLFALLILMVGYGALRSDVKGWQVLITGCLAVALLGVSRLPEKCRRHAYAVPFGALLLVNGHAIFQRLLPAFE